MRKIWLIATTTYRHRVRSGRFLILTFALPLLMVGVGVVAVLTAVGDDTLPIVGYVDQTGQLATVEQVAVEDDTLHLIPFPDVEEARATLLDGDIGGYLLISEGYFDGEAVTYFADEEPGARVEEGLKAFMYRALFPDQPQWLFERLLDPAAYTYVAQTSGEAVAEGPALFVRLFAPAALAIVFVFTIVFGTNQMGSAIIQEKEQRAMEIVITSLRPRELVAGKVLGLTLLSLTQFGIWAGGGIGAALLIFADDIEMQSLAIPWGVLLWGILLIVPAYFMFAMLAAGLGIVAGSSQQAQQLAGILGLLGVAPLWVLAPILTNPDGAVAVGLTLFPLTAPSIALFRMVLGNVPPWQLVASLTVLLLSLVASVWFVARIFRAAMLNYGQALRPRQIWQALAQAQ